MSYKARSPLPGDCVLHGKNITRILIVDDHPIICDFLHEMLSPEADLEICAETGSVSEAKELIKIHRPDIAIIDISLEDGNGLELITELRQTGDKTTVPTRYLVFSGQRDQMASRRAAEAGAAGYVSKESAVSDLLQAVRIIQSGGLYFNDDPTPIAKQGSCLSGVPSVGQLTAREYEVYELIGEGVGTSKIAKRMNLSIKTIETHKAKIKNKLLLNSGNELLRHAMHWTWGRSGSSR